MLDSTDHRPAHSRFLTGHPCVIGPITSAVLVSAFLVSRLCTPDMRGDRRSLRPLRRGERQRIAGIRGETLGLGYAELLLNDVRAENHCDHLVLRVAAAHPFAAHTAIRGD